MKATMPLAQRSDQHLFTPSHPLGKVTKGRSEVTGNALTSGYAKAACRVIGPDRPRSGGIVTIGGTIDQAANAVGNPALC
jgi:hypothetical protein